jgi:predicted ATP-grasp superfamily ATP-dependent carboligase
MGRNLLILGASARAAAWSARRAGFSVLAADLFADADLRQMAVAHRVSDYPAGLARIAQQAPPAAWLYTGGLENYPHLVDQIARTRTLWGNDGAILRNIRNPLKLARSLRADGICTLAVRVRQDQVPPNGTWLRKPLRSCGGREITFVQSDSNQLSSRSKWYYQQYVAGVPQSAVYVAHGGQAVLLGVSRQLIGTRWAGADGFGYAGSCGPLYLHEQARAQWQRIGDCLSCGFGLRGLFGVDAVQSDGALWPVEVNPRYTASLEVLERGLGICAIALHADACEAGRLPKDVPCSIARCQGKCILFATAEVRVTSQFVAEIAQLNRASAGVAVADIPLVGQLIGPGRPVTSVLAEEDDPDQVEAKLKHIVVNLRRWLEPARAVRAAPLR